MYNELIRKKGDNMKRFYAAVMATFYLGEWHIDMNTQTEYTTDVAKVLQLGHAYSDAGMLALYIERTAVSAPRVMIEGNRRLVPCPACHL